MSDILELAAMAIDFSSVPIKRRRYSETHTAGLYDGTGKWQKNVPWNQEPAEVTIQGIVMAIPPSEVVNDESGVATGASRMLWTRASVEAPDDTIGKPGDEFLWQGEWYSIVRLWPRSEAGYTKAALGVIRDRGRTVYDA